MQHWNRNHTRRPISRVHMVGACIDGRLQYVVVRATSEASARIAGARKLSEKHGETILPFDCVCE